MNEFVYLIYIQTYLYFSVSIEATGLSSVTTPMKVDSKLEEQHTENHIFHNLENIEDSNEQVDGKEQVDLSRFEEKRECDSPITAEQSVGQLTSVTSSCVVPSDHFEEQSEENVPKEKESARSNLQLVDLNGEWNDPTDETPLVCINSEQKPLILSNEHDSKEKDSTSEKELSIINDTSDHLDDCGNIILNETQNPLRANTSNEENSIVSIIKRSPSDVSERGCGNDLEVESTDARGSNSDTTTDDSKSSQSQRAQNQKSSTHRVKFTEELPTKSTYQFNSSLKSSLSQNTSSMGGTSIEESTPGQNRHAEQQHMSQDPHDVSEDPHNVPPHVMITEEYPSQETRAFGTKIDR